MTIKEAFKLKKGDKLCLTKTCAAPVLPRGKIRTFESISDIGEITVKGVEGKWHHSWWEKVEGKKDEIEQKHYCYLMSSKAKITGDTVEFNICAEKVCLSLKEAYLFVSEQKTKNQEDWAIVPL